MLGRAKLVAFGATENVHRATRFYVEVLGLELRSEDGFAAVLDANGTELRLQKVDKVVPQPYTMLGWRVPDVAGAVAALAARGVKLERYEGMKQDEHAIWQAPSGARVAWFKDPDGNTLSVAQYPA